MLADVTNVADKGGQPAMSGSVTCVFSVLNVAMSKEAHPMKLHTTVYRACSY